MNAIFYPAIFHPEETGYSVEIPDIVEKYGLNKPIFYSEMAAKPFY